MNILLLGKDGQVGTELQRTLLPLGHVIAIGRSDLDLEDLPGLSRLLDAHKPDIIVNAAAYTAVDKAETEIDKAFLLNEHVVKILAEYVQQNGSLLVHYSTDYVYDGLKSGPYIESDPVNPQSIYGASKRAGEVAIVQSGCNYLIFRTSWVFSKSGKNFIKTMLQLARERESLRVVADQHGAPTSAELIADVTAIAISGHQKKSIQNGIYHVTSTGSTSWHQLACYAIDKALAHGITLKLTSQDIHPISTDEYPLPAKRPKNSTLDINTLSSALALQLPHWSVHVDRMMEQLTQLELSV
jgi:dTDP-4-dehydrorhamnose reductase